MSDLVPDEPTVLVVEDEPQLADLYAEYIDDSYTVLTAYSGEAAIEQLDEDIDVRPLADHTSRPVSRGTVHDDHLGFGRVDRDGIECPGQLFTPVESWDDHRQLHTST